MHPLRVPLNEMEFASHRANSMRVCSNKRHSQHIHKKKKRINNMKPNPIKRRRHREMDGPVLSTQDVC